MEMTKERSDVIKNFFPQLAYLISNIVVLIDKNPPHHGEYAQKLKRFAELSTRTHGTGEKPFLIVIQNPVDLAQVKDPNTSFILEQSNRDFYECLANQQVTDELSQFYRDICFIRLPLWTNDAKLFDNQILLLQVLLFFSLLYIICYHFMFYVLILISLCLFVCLFVFINKQKQNQLVKYAEIVKTDSWFARNFWSDHLWLMYVKSVCDAFKQQNTQEQELNVPQIISRLIQPKSSPFQRM
jgi:hypothetical protein